MLQAAIPKYLIKIKIESSSSVKTLKIFSFSIWPCSKGFSELDKLETTSILFFIAFLESIPTFWKWVLYFVSHCAQVLDLFYRLSLLRNQMCWGFVSRRATVISIKITHKIACVLMGNFFEKVTFIKLLPIIWMGAFSQCHRGFLFPAIKPFVYGHTKN